MKNAHTAKSFSLRFKFTLAILLLINGAIFATGYLAKTVIEDSLFEEKKEKLLALAKVLDIQLGPEGYDFILEQHGVKRFSNKEKIQALNDELAPVTDQIASSLPGVGIGYYSRDLDAILTYGPSKENGFAVGKAIAKDHPGREVMRQNKLLVRSGKMVRGEVMNVMLPIERKGSVIGYIWSNELMADIHEEMAAIGARFTYFMILCSLLTIGVILLFTRRAMQDVDKIIVGTSEIRKNFSKRIAVGGGEFGTLANNINALAEDVERATAETNRAVNAIENIMNNAPANVYVCDFSEMRIVYANKSLCTLAGKETLVGQICYKAIFDSDSPCPTCPKDKLFDKKGAPLMDPHFYEVHQDKFNRDYFASARLLEWHDKRLVGLIYATDITDRTLLAAANASNEAQRDFLARMSHEIRTPMNGVLGMVRLALAAKTQEEQLAYIKKIESSATILLGIINGILDFSRLEAGKMVLERVPFDLRQMVDDVCALILPNVQEKGIELRLDIAPGVPRFVKGDRLRLSQIILNLLGNAVKFTGKGHIDLKLYAHHQENDKILLDCIVADTGIGMTEEQQQSIFNPFQQADSSTSRKYGGSGLGLSITKALVKLMGGAMDVRSEQGWGSEFSFHVALEETAAPEHLQPKPQIVENDHQLCAGRTFLVVEDNIINQEIAVAVLSDLGAKVDVANNGQEGYEAFLNHDYDIIFMDLRMPIMDGLEATRHIRASSKHDARTVYIVAMTANVMHEDKEASLKAGMNGHVGKPLDMQELLRYLQ